MPFLEVSFSFLPFFRGLFLLPNDYTIQALDSK